jgi:TolB-like protein
MWKPVVLVAAILLASGGAGSASETSKKVAVLPFQVHGAGDLDYLREGILDMLASRLAWSGKVEVLEEQTVKEALAGRRGSVGEAGARELKRRLGADYLLFGSLTVFADRVSIDAKLLPPGHSQPPLIVYAQTGQMDEIVPRIDDFARSLSTKFFQSEDDTAPARPQEPDL